MRRNLFKRRAAVSVRKPAVVGNDYHGFKAAYSFAHSLDQRDSFGADCGGIGGVFNVAASVNLTCRSEQRRPHQIFRIGRISILSRTLACRDESLPSLLSKLGAQGLFRGSG